MSEDKLGGQGVPPLPNSRVMVLTIYIDKITQRVEIEGLVADKVLCLNVLAETIKTVTNFEVSPIMKPGLGSRMINFGRKIMGRK